LFTESSHEDQLLVLPPFSGALRPPQPLYYVFLFSSLFIIQFFFFFLRSRVSLLRGLCWFIPGVAVGIPGVTYLLTCSASPKQFWSQCLAAWEPSCFLSVKWHGEALYGMGVQGIGVLLFLGGFFSAKCSSRVSVKFLIYRAYTVCLCPLVTILGSPEYQY
jgi:hypothetical protein